MDTARLGPFDADIEALLPLLAPRGRAPVEQLTLEEARTTFRAAREAVQWKPVAVAEVLDLDLGQGQQLPARLYRPNPDQKAAPAILFFHGGGWVIGDLDTYDSLCRKLAVASNRTVLSVDYRLAPEHRFPAAVDDALTAYKSTISQAASLRIDAADIVVCGDSAGGTLASVVALAAPAEGLPTPAAAVLFYPVTDLQGQTGSYQTVANVPLTAATMIWFRDRYLNDLSEAQDWRASPLLASSLAGFPPTFLTSAGHDPLCDEAFLFVDRLRAAGTRVEHRHLPGQIHGYMGLSGVTAEAGLSITAAVAFLATQGQAPL